MFFVFLSWSLKSTSDKTRIWNRCDEKEAGRNCKVDSITKRTKEKRSENKNSVRCQVFTTSKQFNAKEAYLDENGAPKHRTFLRVQPFKICITICEIWWRQILFRRQVKYISSVSKSHWWYVLRTARTFQSCWRSTNKLFRNCCIIYSATRIGIHPSLTLTYRTATESPDKNTFECWLIKFKINKCRIQCHQLDWIHCSPNWEMFPTLSLN